MAIFDRVRYPIAEFYPPVPGCRRFTLCPPLIKGGTAQFTRVEPAVAPSWYKEIVNFFR